MAYIDYITKDYFCKRCGKNELYPNCTGSHIKGYKCKNCGEVNYPIKDRLKKSTKL